MIRKIAISLLFGAVITAAVVGAAMGHESDQITPYALGSLRHGEATLADATSLFGSPDHRRRIDGCVKTLIARWSGGLRMFFERGEDRSLFLADVRRSAVRMSDGADFRVHTGKGLRIDDPVRKVRRLYPNAPGEKTGDNRRFLLRSPDEGAYLMAIARDGRVIRLMSGFSC